MKNLRSKMLIAGFAMAVANVCAAGVANENGACVKDANEKGGAWQLNKFQDNWFVGVGGGISNYYGNHTSYVPFGRRISPNLNVFVGKWVTPAIGFRGNFAWSNMKSADLTPDNPMFDKAYKNVYKTQAAMLSLSGEALFDVTNMIWGYNPKRVYSLVPYAGIGWLRCHKGASDRTTMIVGIQNNFKVSKRFDINVDAKLHAFGEGIDRAMQGPGSHTDLITTFSVGTTYHFGKNGFTKAALSSCEIAKIQNDLKEMNAKQAQMEEDLNQAIKDKEAAEAQARQQAEVKKDNETVLNDAIFFFKINKAELAGEQRVNLGFIAKNIKENDDKVFTITGYADKATGSAEYNEKLSAKRAQTVYDILTEEFGVDKDQLEIVNAGGVDTMFYNDSKLSRAVIVKQK